MPSPPKRPLKKAPKKPSRSPTKKAPKKSPPKKAPKKSPPKKAPKKSPPKKAPKKSPPKKAVNPIEIIKDLPPEIAFEIGLHLGSQDAEKLLGAVVNQLPINYYRHELTTPATRLTDIDAAMRYKKLYESFETPHDAQLDMRDSRRLPRCAGCEDGKRRCSTCMKNKRGAKSFRPPWKLERKLADSKMEATDLRNTERYLDWRTGLG